MIMLTLSICLWNYVGDSVDSWPLGLWNYTGPMLLIILTEQL